MNVEKTFQDFVRYVEEHGLKMRGVAVADEKNIIAEHHFTRDIPYNIYSHTKSYISTAAGIAFTEGKISPDDRLIDYFPEYIPGNMSPGLEKIRLRHLLTMSSGFEQGFLSNDDRRNGVGLPDYAAYIMSQTVKREPGSHFVYSNGDTVLAGRMVEKAVGMRLGEYLYDRLFLPMGQGWPVWEHDPRGHAFGASGLFMRLTDMMKLGQLYLADGVWEGKRILSHEWIRQATTANISTEEMSEKWLVYGYGYQFWMGSYPDSYRAHGAYGQVTIVLPESGLIVAIQCPESEDESFLEVESALDAELLSELAE